MHGLAVRGVNSHVFGPSSDPGLTYVSFERKSKNLYPIIFKYPRVWYLMVFYSYPFTIFVGHFMTLFVCIPLHWNDKCEVRLVEISMHLIIWNITWQRFFIISSGFTTQATTNRISFSPSTTTSLTQQLTFSETWENSNYAEDETQGNPLRKSGR